MTPTEYQNLACRTLNKDLDPVLLFASLGLGLTGEAGEVADLIKKHVAHRHPLDKEKLLKELGDVLWYAAVLCRELNATLEDVMSQNINKLKQRYPEGFSSEKSINRQEAQT